MNLIKYHTIGMLIGIVEVRKLFFACDLISWLNRVPLRWEIIGLYL